MKTTWTVDTESDGFLKEATVIHCAVLKELDTGVVVKFDPSSIHLLPQFLEEKVGTFVCHNAIKHDLPLIEKLLHYQYKGKVFDTLVMSRIMKPFRQLPPHCPNRKAKPHGLEAWGYRVGRGKPDHDDWANYTPAMLHRCAEDVEINELVLKEIYKEQKDGDWTRANPMTMQLFNVFNRIEEYGWKVDQQWMHYCIHRLSGMIDRIDAFLYDQLPYVYVVDEQKMEGEYNYLKKPFNKNGQYSQNMWTWYAKTSTSIKHQRKSMEEKEVAGPFTRVTFRKLSLNKRVEVIGMLLDAGWIPDNWNYNDDGDKTSPKLTKEDDFVGIDGAFGRHLVRRVQARHRRSNIEGLFKLIREDGRIGSRISGLAETSRVKHAGIANIPNADNFFGKHVRKIFIAEDDKILVGVDSAGNQVRQLCALMGDDAYEYEVLHGDVHATNQKAAGLPTRSNAKTFFYGFLFGAGDGKTGAIVQGTPADGKRLKAQFLEGLPLLSELIERLKVEWRSHAHKRTVERPWGMREEYYNGWIEGLDGRPIYIKSEHAILVYVLQNMEAIQMSYALLFAYKWLNKKYTWGKDYGIVCFYHDEINTECRPEIAQEVGEIVKKAIIYAGKYLGIKTPHDGDIKIGANWYAIH